MYRKYFSIVGIFLLLLSSKVLAAAPTKITFWHSMSGDIGEVVQEIVNEYNHSQNKYRIVAVYKGEYVETLTTTVAAFRVHQQPDMVQIFEVGTACMISPKGAIVPVTKVLQGAGIYHLEDQLLPLVRAYYSDQGQLLAMPFNCSTAVMYYNKEAFIKAGLNPEKPPTTWPQLAAVSKSLVRAGYSCGFTTSWPSWIQLESFCAWHNLPYATAENGFKSVDTKVIYNDPLVVKHITMLKEWQKQHLFCYGGRNDDAQALFTSEKAAILFESSGSRSGLAASTRFKLGIAALPYWPLKKELPQNATIGGGAIWVMSGKSKEIYQGIAEFFVYLLSKSVQEKWQAKTGYIPLTNIAIKELSGTDVAIKAIQNKPPNIYSKGIRLGGYTLIREINDIALEEVWSGKKSAQQALDEAVVKNNSILHRFKENVRD